MECAVGDGTRSVGFHGGKSMESHVVEDASEDQVQLVTLDSVFGDERLDILKVDVEGYEARVLRGAAKLLQDKERGPRAIFVEVHPPFWAAFGTQGAEIIEYLRSNDYDVRDLRGQTVLEIRDYGEIVARRCHDHHAGTAQ
jgi:hypothetical protein